MASWVDQYCIRDRARAAAIHVTLSVLAVSVIWAIVRWVWYPGALYYADSAWNILRLMLFVDVVLGPLLTFIVFDRRKTSLRFDLAFIVIFQLAALVYATTLAYQYRPQLLVWSDRGFVTANKPELVEAGLSLQKLDDLKGAGAIAWVSAEPPHSFPDRAATLKALRLRPIPERHAYYRIIDNNEWGVVLAAGRDMVSWGKEDQAVKADVDKFLGSSKYSLNELAFLPISGRGTTAMFVFHRPTRALVGYLH
jgi:hypothetical protein